jgi:Cu/Ag efflux protein CusF
MRNKWLLLVVLLVGSLALQPALAGQKKAAPDDGSDADKAVTTVDAVDSANGKITLEVSDNKQELTYGMALGSTVTIDGTPADLSKIKPGMTVLSYTEADETSLQQIDVSNTKAKAPPAAKKKK